MDVRFTANFLTNLDSIEAFWEENTFPRGHDHLLDELQERVLPHLARHPRMGRRFTPRRVHSVEAQAMHDALVQRLKRLSVEAEVREYVMDSYLILYLVLDQTLHLLSIRHHKQLAFDLQDFLGMPD
jgi:plasmid stabilization system protein ParE